MVNIDLSSVVRDGHAVVGLRGELDLNDAAGVTVAVTSTLSVVLVLVTIVGL